MKLNTWGDFLDADTKVAVKRMRWRYWPTAVAIVWALMAGPMQEGLGVTGQSERIFLVLAAISVFAWRLARALAKMSALIDTMQGVIEERHPGWDWRAAEVLTDGASASRPPLPPIRTER